MANQSPRDPTGHSDSAANDEEPPSVNLGKGSAPGQGRVRWSFGGEEGKKSDKNGENDNESDEDEEDETHPLFLEMDQLTRRPSSGLVEWKETARWIKYEEDVEEGGNRWSKPHVGTLSLHSLIEVRSLLVNNLVMLNMTAGNLLEISEQVADELVASCGLDESQKANVVDALARGNHRHLYQEGKDKDGGKNGSKPPTGNTHLMRKILPNAEACNVLVGDLNFLDRTLSAFIRLSKPVLLEGVTEVQIPTRFLFVLLGPMEGTSGHHEVGRAVSTLLSDEYFVKVAYKAQTREDILVGVDDFLDAVTVLPPAKWDPNIRIEPLATVPSNDPRKRAPKHPGEPDDPEPDSEEDEEKRREEAGLVRTGKFFGGLINDCKRKRPWYLSDFKDALAVQCIASWIYLYFACLTPIITFGGLLGKATHQKMAAIESLVSGFICGIGYGFFSGQPLTILGSTGPILVFEKVLDELCDRYGFDYLELRFWIGLWVGLILIILVALDASAFVSYITRFTEENFATLVSIIFVVEAFKNVAEIKDHEHHLEDTVPGFEGRSMMNSSGLDGFDDFNFSRLVTAPDGPENCPGGHHDVFLMSILLFAGTFTIAILLKNFRNSSFFPAKVRTFISDFSVIIAIVCMSLIDLLGGLKTPKLEVPENFAPTLPTRGWLIKPFGKNPFWTVFATILPAILATILISMDQQITAVIVNRKEHKLKKGCGYHLDLLVVAFLIIICSIMGIPWFVAATVQAITHVDSLKMESECAAPGEKPQFLGVREQRVTQIAISIMIGLSVVMTPVLKNIPMPVLYGVFLYMGYSGLQSMQLFDRILLVFMPKKYQPDYEYLRHVPLLRIHLFTLIQLACLIMLWLIKSFKSTSVLFPLMLVVMIIVRKLLDKVFSQRELKLLDHLMPKSTKPRDLTKTQNGESSLVDLENNLISSDNLKKNQLSPEKKDGIEPLTMRRIGSGVNVTEELNTTKIWSEVNKNFQSK